MRSGANKIKGHGVGSCYDELLSLIKTNGNYKVSENARGKFDIVHYHTINLNYYFERLLTPRKATVSIGYVHFLPETIENSLNLPWLYKGPFYRYILAFYNSMDYLVTVNPAIIEKIRKCGILKPKVCCIPNFVSKKSFFPKDKSEKHLLREKYKLPDKFTVLSAGQLQTRKGVGDFIKTAVMTPDAHFIWAGGFSFGKMTDGYNEIKKLTANPPENVTFLGIVDRSEMNDVYNIADVYFLPSFDELFPMTILEALCCRVPLLLRDIEVYKGILAGSYLSGNSPEEFSEKIKLLMTDTEFYEACREKSLKCRGRYTEELIAEQWDEFYKTAYNRGDLKDA